MSGEIKLYNTLRNKLGDDGALELVGFIKSEIKNEIMDLKDVFMTKADKVELKTDLINSMKEIFLTKDDKVELVLLVTKQNRTANFISVAQFIAIVAALLAIITFSQK